MRFTLKKEINLISFQNIQLKFFLLTLRLRKINFIKFTFEKPELKLTLNFKAEIFFIPRTYSLQGPFDCTTTYKKHHHLQ
jgi:hypothetical protein